MGKASGERTWGDTNHVPPKVSHVHVEQYEAAARVKTFGLVLAGSLLTLAGFGGGCIYGKLTLGGQQLQVAVSTVLSACV